MAVMAIVVVADHSSQEHGAAGTTASNERAAAAMAEENRLSGNETHAQLSASDSGQESDVGACSAKELSKEVTNLFEGHPWGWKGVVQTALRAGFQVVRGSACLLRDPFWIETLVGYS